MFYNNKHRSACGAQYDRRASYYPNNVTVARIGVTSHKLANDLDSVFILVIIAVVITGRRIALAGNSGFKSLKQL